MIKKIAIVPYVTMGEIHRLDMMDILIFKKKREVLY